MLRDAHDDAAPDRHEARAQLLQRYSGCVYRYLSGAVRDDDVAEDLCHEFALRFLSGAFHRASPEKGRFRDYVKTVLVNLVNDHFRIQGRWADRIDVEQVAAAAPAADFEETAPSFEETLAQELLDHTWEQLRVVNERYYAVLRLRIEAPDLNAREMAETLTERLGQTIAHATVRKTLERARVRFAELLVQAAEETLACATADQLTGELRDLGLLSYCRSAIEKRYPREE